MKRFLVKEDKLSSKLAVRFSSRIAKEINSIDDYNQYNVDALYQWRDYLDGIKRYISNPVIAWDYTNRYSRFPNGAVFIDDFDYNVGYFIKTDNITNQPYVYVFMVNLNPESFGLKVPSTLKENKSIRLTESQLRHIIRKTLQKTLYN